MKLEINESSSTQQMKQFLITLKRVQNLENNGQRSTQQSDDKWIILRFTDKRYLPVAKLWYKILSSIEYQNIGLLTMDVFC